jgi:hypothetical protein
VSTDDEDRLTPLRIEVKREDRNRGKIATWSVWSRTVEAAKLPMDILIRGMR